MIEKYINDFGRQCYRGVTPETLFKYLEFHEANRPLDDIQWSLHTNLGSITVVDRLTGYSGYVRDTETGYRDVDGLFWLASGMQDVRDSAANTIQDAIDWIKNNANTCVGYSK